MAEHPIRELARDLEKARKDIVDATALAILVTAASTKVTLIERPLATIDGVTIICHPEVIARVRELTPNKGHADGW